MTQDEAKALKPGDKFIGVVQWPHKDETLEVFIVVTDRGSPSNSNPCWASYIPAIKESELRPLIGFDVACTHLFAADEMEPA